MYLHLSNSRQPISTSVTCTCQASVHVDSPRGFTARFMTNMWAMFAVVFLAIYTANLAAFMITREEFHELSGLDDPRIARPLSQRPSLKFGTVPWSHTDATLAKYFPEPHAYMTRLVCTLQPPLVIVDTYVLIATICHVTYFVTKVLSMKF